MCRAHTWQLFWATCDSLPCLGGGFYPLDGLVGGWVGGMGRFGIISPPGLAPFRLEICTSPFLVGDMDWPLSGWGYGLAPFPHLLSPSSLSLMHFRATRFKGSKF